MKSLKTITLANGLEMPNLGQGTWLTGEDHSVEDKEIDIMRYCVDQGLTLIDTAEGYGDGQSEDLIGKAIVGLDREKLFIVDKFHPFHGGKKEMREALETSLKRLGTDYVDLYLLHYLIDRDKMPSFQEIVDGCEELAAEGKIKGWGVSNFDLADLEELFACKGGDHCLVNQIQYNIAARGAEYALLPWMREHNVKMMAYAPMIHSREFRGKVLEDPILNEMAARYGISTFELLLCFACHGEDYAVLFRCQEREYVDKNVKAALTTLSAEDMAVIDERYPAPKEKIDLQII